MQVFGLYESTPVWPAERHAPATDGFVLINPVSPGQVFDMENATELFELQHRCFVEQLPRPHKLALHLGVSFHALAELEALSNPSSEREPLRYCGTQGLLPPTCLLQEWALEEVANGVEQSCALLEATIDLEKVRKAGGRALLRVSVHVFPEELEIDLAAHLPEPIELPHTASVTSTRPAR